jgi:hypothetical protein
VFDAQGKIIGCVILIGKFPEGLIEQFGRNVAVTVRQISSKLGADIDTVYHTSIKEKTRDG